MMKKINKSIGRVARNYTRFYRSLIRRLSLQTRLKYLAPELFEAQTAHQAAKIRKNVANSNAAADRLFIFYHTRSLKCEQLQD